MPPADSRTAIDTRAHIKRVAMGLFSARDPDTVSTREIAAAAGQRNVSVISYHFGSKEALLRELVNDVADVVDADRRRRLDEIEAAGGPRTLREMVAVLAAHPRAAFAPADADGPLGAFIDVMLATQEQLLFEARGPELGPSTHACLDHVRRFLPPMPEPILSQRLRMALLLAFQALSSRREALSRPQLWPDGWTSELAEQTLIDAMVGLLEQPVSTEAQAALRR